MQHIAIGEGLRSAAGRTVATVLLTLLGGLSLTAQGASYLRFQDAAGQAHFAERLADGRVQPLDAAPWLGGQARGTPLRLSEAQLLAPVTPRSVIAIGYNYPSHTADRPDPTAVGMFAKLPGSITGPGAVIPYPRRAKNLHYEGEVVIVMGAHAYQVPPEEALSKVFGYTAGNDVSERDWQAGDLQWLRAKASDGFGPVGPWIVTDLDPQDLTVKTFLNGELKQADAVRNLFFDFATIISEVTETIALAPGDVIFTGTPGTTEPMQPGDEVVVEVSGVGRLVNRVGAP